MHRQRVELPQPLLGVPLDCVQPILLLVGLAEPTKIPVVWMSFGFPGARPAREDRSVLRQLPATLWTNQHLSDAIKQGFSCVCVVGRHESLVSPEHTNLAIFVHQVRSLTHRVRLSMPRASGLANVGL